MPYRPRKPVSRKPAGSRELDDTTLIASDRPSDGTEHSAPKTNDARRTAPNRPATRQARTENRAQCGLTVYGAAAKRNDRNRPHGNAPSYRQGRQHIAFPKTRRQRNP